MKYFLSLLKRLNMDEKIYIKEFLRVKQMKYSPILEVMEKFNGRPYSSFYEFLDRDLRTLEIIFTAPKKWGIWYFNDPIKEIRMLPNGVGSLIVLDDEVTPANWIMERKDFKKAMIRFIVQRASKKGAYGLLTPGALFNLVKGGIIPHVLRILIYTPERRYKIDINLPTSEAFADFRWEKIPYKIFKRRNVKEYLLFDKIYASLNIPIFTKMVFESLFESNGMDLEVLTLIFDVSRNIIKNNLDVLMKYNLVEEDTSGIYYAKLPKPSQ